MVSLLGERIVAQARTYLGVPFHHAGRSRAGLDCAGLLLCVARDLGLTDWDLTDYTVQVDRLSLERHLSRFCYVVAFGPLAPVGEWGYQPEAGQIALFSTDGGEHGHHLGICTGEGLIHACSKFGKVVEHSYGNIWRRRTVAIYQWRGEADDG